MVIVAILYSNGSLNDFYPRYILTNIDYTSKGLNFAFIDPNLYEPYRFRLRSLYPFFIIICFTFLLTITNINSLKKVIFSQNFYFFSIVFLVTVFEILQPRNYLQHYYLLLYQPLIPLFICFKNFEIRKSIILIILVLQFLFYWYFRKNDVNLFLYAGTSEKILYSKITDDIKLKAELNNCDKKYILEWGWNNRYYVYGNFIPVSRDFVNVHLFTHEGYLQNYYIHSFISDIERKNLKRILVIDDLQRLKRFKLYTFPEFIQRYGLSKYFRSLTILDHNDIYNTYVIELF